VTERGGSCIFRFNDTVLKKPEVEHVSHVLLAKAKEDAMKRILRRKGEQSQNYYVLLCHRLFAVK
jgi:hypothetical protein